MTISSRGFSHIVAVPGSFRSFSTMSFNLAPVKAGVTKIGWIGTGVMGKSMVSHLMKAGFECHVYNRTASKASDLVAQGAVLVSTPAEMAKNVDIVFSIVGYPSDVENVFLNPEFGVLSTMKQGGIIVDMTTSEPSLAQKIADQAKLKGVASLDAPVSGGDIGAREARLSIMVGGEPEAYETVLPLFQLMGKNVKLMGGPGKGQHTKMVNQVCLIVLRSLYCFVMSHLCTCFTEQILIANNMIGVCEGLLYAYKAGLDINDVSDLRTTKYYFRLIHCYPIADYRNRRSRCSRFVLDQCTGSSNC